MSDEGPMNLPIVQGPESFSFKKDEGFSHEALVMEAYRKCIHALSKEMVEGRMKSFRNQNTGKEEIVFQEDTRRTAIECITTLKNVMIADLKDKSFLVNITKLFKKIDERFDFYKKKQKEWWEKLPHAQRIAYTKTNTNFEIAVMTDNLDNDTFFYWNYMNDKTNMFREIFEQLELCLADARYLKKKKVTDLGVDIY